MSSDVQLLNTLYYFALTHDLLGDRDRAFHWLDRAVERPTWMRAVLGSHPAFEALRADRRFTAILERVAQLPAGSGQ